MRNFITKSLRDVKKENKKHFEYALTRENGDTISCKGDVTNGLADFVIDRIKVNGHHCSSVPVVGMPLTEEAINTITEIAVESL